MMASFVHASRLYRVINKNGKCASVRFFASGQSARETSTSLHTTAAAAGAVFERRCVTLLQQFGCRFAIKQGGSQDRGIDLHGHWKFIHAAEAPIVVQCKNWKVSMSASSVRDFIGASTTPLSDSQSARCLSIFMSASPFSAAAIAASQSTGLPILLLHCNSNSADSKTSIQQNSNHGFGSISGADQPIHLLSASFNSCARDQFPFLGIARLKAPRTSTQPTNQIEFIEEHNGTQYRLWRPESGNSV